MQAWCSRSYAMKGVLAGLVMALIVAGYSLRGETAPGTPVKLTISIATDPSSMDGQDITGIADTIVRPQMYDRLVDFDENGRLVPQLATSWRVSQDGLTWTFTLRRGHKFWDGTPVNAEAVKRSYERILDEKNRLAYRSWFDSIETITAVDEYTVAFRTKAPFLFLANRMATPPGSIVSAAAAAQVDQKTFASAKPMGSGPFMFREWIRGSRVVLAKNPNHWLASRSNIDIIELRVVPEDSARAIGLETGEHDMTQIIAPQEADRLKANANLQVLNVPVWRINGIYFNTAKKPFDDVRVRQAVAHAMDKKAIVDTFLKGYALVADSPLPKGLWSYKSLKPFDYNPARAKQLLAQAGHPNGFSTTMWVPIGFYVNAQQISQAITEQLRAVGIQVKLEIMEGGKWLDLLRSKGPQEAQWEMSYYGWGTWSGEPDYALRLVFHSANWAPRGTNRNFYKNAEVDTLLTRGPTIVNEAERRAAYEKAQELIWNDQPWAYTFSVNQPTVAKKTLRGLKVLPTEQVVLREASLTR